MFYGITDLPTFVLGTVVIVLLPGPNSLYVMTVASRWGLAAGYRGAAGIFAGDLILMTLAATGAASLLQANPALFLGLRYVGAAYLALLGLGLLRAAITRWRQGPTGPVAAAPDDDSVQPFRVALLISLMNPKAILFYVSFFIQFVSPDYARPGLSFLILGTIVQACSMLYLSALIVGGRQLAGLFGQRPRLAATGLALTGALFAGFGLRMALGGGG